MDFLGWLGIGMDVGTLARLAVLLVGVVIASSGGTWLAIKRWFTPNSVLRVQDALVDAKERIEALEAERKSLRTGIAPMDYEQGYEVLNWWGETGKTPSLAESFRALSTASLTGARQKRYPRTILIRKTGQIKELPYPPLANKIPTEDEEP